MKPKFQGEKRISLLPNFHCKLIRLANVHLLQAIFITPSDREFDSTWSFCRCFSHEYTPLLIKCFSLPTVFEKFRALELINLVVVDISHVKSIVQKQQNLVKCLSSICLLKTED